MCFFMNLDVNARVPKRLDDVRLQRLLSQLKAALGFIPAELPLSRCVFHHAAQHLFVDQMFGFVPRALSIGNRLAIATQSSRS